MIRRLVAFLALFGLLASPGFALADRRELHTVVEVSPQVTRFHDPVTEKAAATSFDPGGSVAVYYGLTNSIHFGGALHFAISRNLSYSPIHVILRDGSPSDGALYVDATSLGNEPPARPGVRVPAPAGGPERATWRVPVPLVTNAAKWTTP